MILVYGANGKQGRATVKALLERGHKVRALVRPGQTPSFTPEVEIAYGDMSDLASLRAAHVAVEQVVLTLPLIFSPETILGYTRNALDAAKASGTVSRIILNTSHPIPDGKTGITAIDLKIDVEELVFRSGVDTVSIRPTLYLGNLTEPFVAPAIISQGVLPYPLPAAQEVAWISWEDTASAIAAVASARSIANTKINVGGSQPLSGNDLAQILTDTLKRKIDYVPLAIEDFAQGVNSALGAPVGDEIGAFYRWFQDEGRKLLMPDTRDAEARLGLRLTPAAAWAQKQSWS